MLRRAAIWSTALLLVAVLVAATAFAILVRRPFPATSGEHRMAGLDGTVDVDRDKRGVPHVAADTPADLFRVQGYVHAQDRFWQMDVWRHIAQGRAAELFGASALPGDRFLRTLGWTDVAREEWDAMPAAEREWLSAYADGVNAYLDGRAAGALSLHYTLLAAGGTAYEPEPWRPVDTLTFHKLLSWDLRTNIEQEIERVRLSATLDEDEIDDLFPPYPDEHPAILEDGDGDGAAAGPQQRPGLPHAAGGALRRAAGAVEVGSRMLGPAGAGVGSNSWVVGPQHSATGAPLLANDPHLGIQMPSIWYQVGLRCRRVGPDCPFAVNGFSFAGSPGVVIGHTDRIAWGFTNMGADVMDLAVERLHPQDPDRYDAGGDWRPVEVTRETLHVAGGDDEELTVRRTRNGPLIAGAYGLDDWHGTAVEPPDRYDVALRWTALEPSTTVRAILGFNRATDWDSFRGAARHLDVPAQNLVYADVDGNIGYQAPGRIPVRAGGDGRWPVPGGDDAYAWTGWVPFEDLPREFNPDRGFIVTANNPVVDDDGRLTGDWGYGYRAARIEALLAGGDALGPDDAEAMLLDTWNPNADRIVPFLLALPDGDDRVGTGQAILAGWDRRKDADAAGAAVFAAFWRHLLDRVFAERVPEGTEPTGGGRWFAVVDNLLDEPGSPWWSEVGGSRDEVLAAALADAVDELSQRLGSDPSGWRWGDLHTATFRDNTLGQSGIAAVETLLNRGPHPVGGGSEIVNAIGWNAAVGYEVNWLPSMRMVVDLADPDNARAIHTTGQSGHPYHRHYTDLVDDWAAGRFHPMRPPPDAQRERLRLHPD